MTVLQKISSFLNQSNDNDDDDDISLMAYERPCDKEVNDRINLIMERAKHEQRN
jgi:hypothetical protein